MNPLARILTVLPTCLTDDLRKPRYRGHPNRLRGHCYISSEVVFSLYPDRFTPQVLRMRGEVHWYLKDKKTGQIVDPTVGQFKRIPNYAKGRGCGFLTKGPSQRARVVLNRIGDVLTCAE